MQIEIDSDRVASELTELAAFSEGPPPSVTRVVYSAVDLQARHWLREKCREAGLHIREDAVGNMFARWSPNGVEGAAIGTGSHIDAIPNAGRYDGTVGVVGGLEAIRSLQKSGFTPRRPIELLLFTAEEPTRFGIGCLGSRLMSGAMSVEQAEGLRDSDGNSLNDLRQAAGFGGSLAEIRLPEFYYASFVELHIEQGPLLEATQSQAGLVTNIAAPASMRLVIEGEGGHAGAVLMPNRRDALTAAAEMILSVENLALATGSADTVATTGICDVFPGAVNSIPSRVTLAIDVRDINRIRRNSVVQEIRDTAGLLAQKRGVTINVEVLNADDPAHADQGILEVLRNACAAENISFIELVSRAYHDSLFLARVTPIAMLFIPCRNGVSHRPDEFASNQDIVNGIRVLARTLATLAS